MSRVDDVIVSGHAEDRWAERAQETDLEPADAWRDATGMPGHVAVTCGVDEVRYHLPTDTAFLRRDTTIATILSMDPADINTSRGNAVREAAEAQFVQVGNSDMQFTEADS